MTDNAELQQIAREVESSRWHLDKKIPIALIATIALQTLAAVWFAAILVKRVEVLELRQAEHSNTIRDLRQADSTHSADIAVVKESERHIGKQLDNIEDKVDRLLEAK